MFDHKNNDYSTIIFFVSECHISMKGQVRKFKFSSDCCIETKWATAVLQKWLVENIHLIAKRQKTEKSKFPPFLALYILIPI